MSRFSAFDADLGQWGEIVWRAQRDADGRIFRYVVSVGDRKVGEVWPMRPGWHAVSYARPERLLGLRGVDDFRTRWSATEYLLNVGLRTYRTENRAYRTEEEKDDH